MIDRHYGHLVRDGREHAINALMHRGRWWTLRGRRKTETASTPTTKACR